MVPECTWVPKPVGPQKFPKPINSHRFPKPVRSQYLTCFPTLTAIQVPSSLLPSLHHPREWTYILLYHAAPRGVLLLIRAPAQLVQNLNVGTLRTRICEQRWTQANASQTSKPQVTAGSHQRPLQPTIPWIILHQFSSLSQAKTRMQLRMDRWMGKWVHGITCMKMCEG
jgi:hypothetical protein